jgi:tetratricopeptide (TPR) repeat protein
MERVDHALFERDLDEAISTGVVFQKWAAHDFHFQCKAASVMAAVYAVCRLRGEAEKKLVTAKQRLHPDCKDCMAVHLDRTGTFLIYEARYQAAHAAYSRASDFFLDLGARRDAGRSILNRGVTLHLMNQHHEALKDEERALELLGDEFNIYIIMASINIASILMHLGKADLALDQIEASQEMLAGINSPERPRLILRWMRALLLEAQMELKTAGEMLDRIETRMRGLDMTPELRVLLADRARIARRPDVIVRIARKAHAMEDVPRIMAVIEKVANDPSRENILAWRNALDSYVPPFPAMV